jgi:hypothetical protein
MVAAKTPMRVRAQEPFLRYALLVSQLRKLIRSKRRRQIQDLFARRAERFQSMCGWCGKHVGEDEPVVAVGARAHEGIDLSLVEGKVIELTFELSGKTVLGGVTGFESEAKAEGKDVIFMTCSDECGRQIQTAFAEELARGLAFQRNDL